MIGLVLSLLMIKQGLVIQVEWSFLLIVLVSVLANKINKKLTCLAYVMTMIFVLDWLLVAVGLKETLFNLSYIKMIYVVAMLHFIEGIFTYLWGGLQSYPIITYRGKEVAGGYEASGSWLIPLLFFSMGGLYVPIVASVVYYNQSFVLSPRKKAKIMGASIGGYGLILLGIGYLVAEGMISLIIGILCMPLLHEILFMIDDYIESKPFKYPVPKKGIRIMEIMGSSTPGMIRGDIIRAINGKIIEDEIDYEQELKQEKKLNLTIEKITGEKVHILCDAEELRQSKLIFLPPY